MELMKLFNREELIKALAEDIKANPLNETETNLLPSPDQTMIEINLLQELRELMVRGGYQKAMQKIFNSNDFDCSDTIELLEENNILYNKKDYVPDDIKNEIIKEFLDEVRPY